MFIKVDSVTRTPVIPGGDVSFLTKLVASGEQQKFLEQIYDCRLLAASVFEIYEVDANGDSSSVKSVIVCVRDGYVSKTYTTFSVYDVQRLVEEQLESIPLH